MSNTGWIMIGLVFIVLAIAIGAYLYQKSKNDAEAINAQKLAMLQSGLGSTLTQGYQQGGAGGWFSQLLGNTLNSQTVVSATQAGIPLLGKLNF